MLIKDIFVLWFFPTFVSEYGEKFIIDGVYVCRMFAVFYFYFNPLACIIVLLSQIVWQLFYARDQKVAETIKIFMVLRVVCNLLRAMLLIVMLP